MTRSSVLRLFIAAVTLTGVAVSGSAADGDDAAGTSLLESVGMIACERELDGRSVRSWGTGAVVGSRDTILTVAHIFVAESRGATARVEFAVETDCVFRLFDTDGELVFESGFEHAAFGAFLRNRGLPNEDWAVLRTREHLPASVEPLPFASTGIAAVSASTALPIEVAAFHAERRRGPRVPQLTRGSLFAIEYAGFDRLAHTADTDRMSSGAPVVHRTPSGRGVVLGIHRSEAEYGEFRLAVPLARELVQALNAYAHGQTPSLRQRSAERLEAPRVAPSRVAPLIATSARAARSQG